MAPSEQLQALEIPDDKKTYIIEKLNKHLEEMVTEVLVKLPKEPKLYMLEWLCGKANEELDPIYAAVKKNRELKSQKEELDKEYAKFALLQASVSEESKKMEEKELSDEDDGEDELDEIPPAPVKAARGSVSAEAYGAWNQKKAFTPKVIAKEAEQKTKLRDLLTTSFMFKALEAKDIDTIVDALEENKIAKGTRVINQGEDGDYLFIIESGEFSCLIKTDDGEKAVKTCKAGEVFGELALLYNCKRAASVDAMEDCVTWKLDQETFKHIVAAGAQERRNQYCDFLKSVQLLQTMDDYQRSQIADALKSEVAKAGDEIIKQGDEGNTFYILEAGEAVAIKDGKEVMEYKAGMVFGELALLKADRRAATVQAKTEVKLLTLDRITFTRMLGGLEDILLRNSASYK